MDQVLFRDTRDWLCVQVEGDVLEVGIGTGLNLSRYPPGATITGIDLSPAMVGRARERAATMGLRAHIQVGDAEALPWQDDAFDSVLCTFALCGIPDPRRAVDEMVRVLRPGGQLLLADHVRGSVRPVRALQRLAEMVTVPALGEHLSRRPWDDVVRLGLQVEARERFAAGVVERLVARKPSSDDVAQRLT